jgi:hypothetical protein
MIIGLDAGHSDVLAAEHWLHAVADELGQPEELLACTHLMSQPFPHVAVSLAVDAAFDLTLLPSDAVIVVADMPAVAPRGLERLLAPATLAAEWHGTRRGGRAVIYPGVARLTGVRTVTDILEASAIERIALVGGSMLGVADPLGDMKVETRDHVRPQWMSGRLTLMVQQAAADRLAPFEVPNPSSCC